MNEQEKDDEIARLQKLLNRQDSSAKMLVRRDLELTRAYEKLEDLGRLKSDFISVVAHQLRTPLSVTKWSLDMLWESSQEILSPEQIRVLVRGRESNERMISLVDDLLNVDLHEMGKVQYSFNTISIKDVIVPVVEQLKAVAQQREIDLVLTIAEELSDIRGDTEKLKSVVQNLIENAIKYTPKGGTVTVEAKEVKADIVVSVRDTGIGVPQAERDNIFSKFYRGANAIKTITEGSGLGLFIAKRIIKRHGGKIWFESEEGKGAIFSFSLQSIQTKDMN